MPAYSIELHKHKCSVRETCYSTLLFTSGQVPPANTLFKKNTPTLEPVTDQELGQVLDNLDRETLLKLIECIADFGFQILDSTTDHQTTEK